MLETNKTRNKRRKTKAASSSVRRHVVGLLFNKMRLVECCHLRSDVADVVSQSGSGVYEKTKGKYYFYNGERQRVCVWDRLCVGGICVCVVGERGRVCV